MLTHPEVCTTLHALVEEAYTYLVSNKYPECITESKKGVIRKKAAKLTISTEGELFYKHKQGKGNAIGFMHAAGIVVAIVVFRSCA